MESYKIWTAKEIQEAVDRGVKIFQGIYFDEKLCQTQFHKGTYFKDCLFSKALLHETTLEDAIFQDTEFESTEIYKIKASRALFENVRMIDGCRIDGSELINAEFRNFKTTLYEGIILNEKLRITGSKLMGASFIGANLQNCMLEYCNLSEAVFKNAKMRHASLGNSQIQNADFTDAENLTINQLERINITARDDNHQYIGGITFKNSLRLFNLLFEDYLLYRLKEMKHQTDICHMPYPDIHNTLMFWAIQASTKYYQMKDQISRLPNNQIPNERELMHDVLKNDLRVKGLETLGLF